MVTLTRAEGRFTYRSLHLHTREGQVGALTREARLALDLGRGATELDHVSTGRAGLGVGEALIRRVL